MPIDGRLGVFRRMLAAAMLSSMLLFAARSRAESLQLFTEDTYPASFLQNGVAAGWVVEVVREIQNRVGDANPINVVPWARAYHIISNEPNAVVFAMTLTEERRPKFQWVGPLDSMSIGFYAKSESSIKINSLEEAKQVEAVGVPREFYSDEELTRLGFTNLDRSMTLDILLKKLLSGRNNLMVVDNKYIDGAIMAKKLDPGAVKIVYAIGGSSTYIAFSKDAPSSIVLSWQGALDSMKEDGTFSKIYKKWWGHAGSKNLAEK